MDFIKTIHITTALISIMGFILRNYWLYKSSERLTQKWVKISPHINDTVLLVTAIILAIQTQQYPFVDNWLTAKVVALFVYIGFGMVALKQANTRSLRAVAFICAVIVFVYIVGAAITKNVLLVNG